MTELLIAALRDLDFNHKRCPKLLKPMLVAISSRRQFGTTMKEEDRKGYKPVSQKVMAKLRTNNRES